MIYKEPLIIRFLRLVCNFMRESTTQLKLGSIRCNAKVPEEPSLLWQLLQNQGRPVATDVPLAMNCHESNGFHKLSRQATTNSSNSLQFPWTALCNESCNISHPKINEHFTTKHIYIYIHVGSCRQTLVPNIQCVVQIQTPALCWSDREWLRVHGEESKIGNEWMKSYQRKKTNAMLFGAQIDCLVGGFSPFEKY